MCFYPEWSDEMKFASLVLAAILVIGGTAQAQCEGGACRAGIARSRGGDGRQPLRKAAGFVKQHHPISILLRSRGSL